MRLFQCAKCPATAKFKTGLDALKAGWIWAMESPWGRVGDDGCPDHAMEILGG